ncbi:MAG: SpoIID/LytB domain protein [Mycobacterium sp.]|nr:SpoIID/LytB domain protein [Mycobacterium sp.]
MTRKRARTRVTAALAVTLLASIGTLVGCTAAATTNQVYARPASGVFTVTGHGWGHGAGMSQWGAEGAAALGVPASTIVATYYPGTQASVMANSPIRVKLTGTNSWDLAVLPAAGLTVTDGAGRRLVLPSGASMWRVIADSTGQHLQRQNGANWTQVPVGGQNKLASPVRFTDTASLISVVYPSLSSRDYRGSVASTVVGTGQVMNVVTLGMEDYLRGVVPQEASPSWYPAALQAQAIAARSYAAQQRSTAGSLYDICDSTACQYFGGTRLRSPSGAITPIEYASTDAAIRATTGQIRTYGGRPAFTQFSSSNGGYSTAGSQPYLVAKADPWDGAVANPMHTWTATLPVSAIEARYPAVGHLLRLRVTQRDGHGDWGGRVQSVVLEGVDRSGHATSVNATGDGIYNSRMFGSYADGLRSNWWTITNGTLATSLSSPQAPAKKAYAATLIAGPSAVAIPSSGYYYVTLRWRNDGTAAWPMDGLTVLSTASPAGRSSASSGWGWPSRAVVGALGPDQRGAKSVAPGQTASISFAVWGNNQPHGVNYESFQPIRGNLAFGGPATIKITRF